MSPLHVPPLPAGLLSAADRSPAWAEWITQLPRLVGDLLAEWELDLDGPLMHGHTAVVAPVLTTDGSAAVLKIARQEPETRHEILGLQTWAGDGVVRLLRGDPHRGAMVLERAGPRDLTGVDDLESCEIVAGMYRRLHVPAPPRFDRLTDFVAVWIDDLAIATRAVPRRIVEQAVHLGRALVSDPASVGTLVHTDLHHQNVLAGEREPWLVIDPKPMSGDPHYEIAPMLWNRWSEVVASGDVRAAVRRRFHTMVDVAGLDEDRARSWVVVRESLNALWSSDHDDLTKHLTILKAVQD